MKTKKYFGLFVFVCLVCISFPAFSYYNSGEVWFDPGMQEVEKNAPFTTNIYVKAQLLTEYEIEVTYDGTLISLNTDTGLNGVTTQSGGFVTAVNPNNVDSLVISGFDVNGRTPDDYYTGLYICTINWIALAKGVCPLSIQVNTLLDDQGNTIGTPNGIQGLVSVLEVIKGDVNNDITIDIIDALLVAQYYVGLSPDGFEIPAGNVTANDGSIDIVDALTIAQYYVGLRNVLPGADAAETIDLNDMAVNTQKYIGEMNVKFTLESIVPNQRQYWDYDEPLDIYTITIRDRYNNSDTFDIFTSEYSKYTPYIGMEAVFTMKGRWEPVGEPYSGVYINVLTALIIYSDFEACRVRIRM